MESNYKSVMEKYTDHVKIDAALAKRLNNFANKFVNKNDDHINFFGSNLSGVYSIYFTTMDKNELMIDVIGDIDDAAIRKEIRQLPDVGATWVVATEPVTIVGMYLVHRFLHSDLPEKVKHRAMVDAAMIIHYKFITSLMNHYFTYNVDMATALATYSALSRKYTIKQEGTWQKILERRVNDLLFNQDSWHEVIKTFSPDTEVVKMVSDMQYRMRSMVKNIAEVTYRLHDQGVGVDSSGDMIPTDDGLKVKDVSRLQSGYRDYILDVLNEPRSLIKTELVHLIGEAVTTMPEPPLYEVLTYISKQSRERNKNVTTLCTEILMYVFNYLQKEGKSDQALNNLSLLIEKIKALITASKTNDPAVLKMRKLSDKLVKKGCSTRSPAALSGLRTGLILYIVIRTLTRQHYS